MWTPFVPKQVEWGIEPSRYIEGGSVATLVRRSNQQATAQTRFVKGRETSIGTSKNIQKTKT